MSRGTAFGERLRVSGAMTMRLGRCRSPAWIGSKRVGMVRKKGGGERRADAEPASLPGRARPCIDPPGAGRAGAVYDGRRLAAAPDDPVPFLFPPSPSATMNPTPGTPWLRIALGLSMGAALSLGLARFAYGLLLPPMREDLGWSYLLAGSLNTANALGYLLG